MICGPIDIKSSLMREMVRCPQNMNQQWTNCCVTRFECVNQATRTRWMNYVQRKMSDVRSRYDRFTIAPIYVRMPQYMDECYGLFTIKANHFHLERQQGKSEGFESCHRPIIRKHPIWVKIGDILCRVTLKFDGWPWKTIGHLSFAVSSFVQHFIAIREFKLELQSGNAQFGSNSTIFRAMWPWNLTDDLEKQ